MGKTVFSIAICFLFSGCSRGIAVEEVYSVRLRKSYADYRDAEIDPGVIDANPESDDAMLKKAGLIKNDTLMLSKFSFGKIQRRFNDAIIISDTFRNGKFEVKAAKAGFEKVIAQDDYPLAVFVGDFIPGGDNELVILKKYYIMNGDNYELTVYSVR